VAAAEEIVVGIIAATDLLLTIQCYLKLHWFRTSVECAFITRFIDQSLLLAGCGR